MEVQINPPKETKIQTKYIVTIDKSLQDEMDKTVNLKKGDVLQGIAIYTSGDMVNDSGTQRLVFTNKQGNKFSVQIGSRGFVPFYEEYKGEVTSSTDASGETFLQKHKNHLLIVGALVVGYLAYKKFKK
jgi:hypothetical protein